jgi:hypothetical protein
VGEGGDVSLELPAMPSEAGDWIENVHMYYRFDYETGKRDDRLVIVANTGAPMYVKYFRPNISAFDWLPISDISLVGRTCSVNYNCNGRDILLISSPEATAIIDGDNGRYVPDCPHFTSLTKHCERIYGSVQGNRRQVWFSDDFDPTNWTVSNTEGGYLDFNDEGGAVLKVVSFLNYLFIFREYEILRLRAFGDQSEFSLTKLFVTTGRIFGDTIALAGDRIMFAADDGVYEFNGENARKVYNDLNAFFKPSQKRPLGCYLHGKYYLACSLTFPDRDKTAYLDEVNRTCLTNALVEFDLDGGAFSILRGVDFYDLTSVGAERDSRIFMLFGNEPARKIGNVVGYSAYFNEPLDALWQSPETDLGYPGRKKVIRTIFLNTGADPVTVGVCLDGERYEYEARGKNCKINVCHGGESVSFYFRAAAYMRGTEISAFSVAFDII